MSLTGFDMKAPPMQAEKILTQFGANVVHQDLDFTMRHEEILGLVGGSGPGSLSC